MRVPAAVRTVLLLVLAVAFVIAFRSLVQVTMVNGHSMDPTYATGDLLVSTKASTYKVGDVITYHPAIITECSMCNVVHRIISGDAKRGWITKGDNNPNQDGWLVHPNEIAGHVIMRVHLPAFLRIAYLPAFWIFLALACCACWLFICAFEVLEEDEPSGPRHLLTPADRLGNHRTEPITNHASLSGIRWTAGNLLTHVRRGLAASPRRH